MLATHPPRDARPREPVPRPGLRPRGWTCPRQRARRGAERRRMAQPVFSPTRGTASAWAVSWGATCPTTRPWWPARTWRRTRERCSRGAACRRSASRTIYGRCCPRAPPTSGRTPPRHRPPTRVRPLRRRPARGIAEPRPNPSGASNASSSARWASCDSCSRSRTRSRSRRCCAGSPRSTPSWVSGTDRRSPQRGAGAPPVGHQRA
jgi:hypothetical protein